ncbi:hypothetical protein CL86_gp093 [Mycobacterium phage SkiPole]|uniref:Uncharacterized protein n=1 Tax=Mycobacterium phage SkiPole TaxID=701456 RepID=D2XRT7_9CAUD|nr:hypothetical protein CL86_gp093 [Mycobacterium phage SkiPole]ADA83828.1 hypothetical protein SKIPOLE_93 [Mycobacterium phage SkiPole]
MTCNRGVGMEILIISGTKCSHPGCETVYSGPSDEFMWSGWTLMPVEQFVFCKNHAGTPDVLSALRASA